MIESRNISVTLAAAYCVWAATFGTFLIAVIIFVGDGGGRAGIIIAEGACILSAVAATVHLKHYAQGLCQVVRDRDALRDDIQRLQRVR